jgi:hypothetical protein
LQPAQLTWLLLWHKDVVMRSMEKSVKKESK